MIAYYPLLLDTSHWDWLSRRWRAFGPRLIAIYDAGCGVCFQIARVVARWDVGRRVAWISSRDAATLPAAVDTALLERTVLVIDPKTQQRWTRSDAVARIFSALPLGSLWTWVLLVPGLRALAGRAYDAFAQRRTKVSAWLGFAACGISDPDAPSPDASRGGCAVSECAPPTPIAQAISRLLPRLRETGVLIALIVLGADLSVSNRAVPPALRWENRPKWMEAAVMYPHVFEGWGMFAPEAPLSDYMVVVDAVTADGRHVDPYNEIGSRVHALPVDDIPVRLGHDSMFCDYTLRIPNAGSYHQAFQDWILRYPERTGNPRDAIVSFEASQVEHASPRPGQTHPTDVRRHTFLSWPHR